MHCLNILRCMIVYLYCIIIMRFQKIIIIIKIKNLKLEFNVSIDFLNLAFIVVHAK